MTQGIGRSGRCGAAALLLVLSIALPSQAIQIERVISPGGIEAWLVPDHTVPVISVSFSFAGGSAWDPEGMAGLAELTAVLLAEAAGPYDHQAFQAHLEDKAIRLQFHASVDRFGGRLSTLTDNQDEAYRLANLALTQPRFDAVDVERVRDAALVDLRRDLGTPSALARRAFYAAVFPGHAYGRDPSGTPDSLAQVNVDAMRRLVVERIGLDTLLVAVSGDITPGKLGPVLDRLFAGLPARAQGLAVPDVTPAHGGETIVVPRESAQSLIVAGQAAIPRDDSDWFAARIMNYILGGGSFSSRLVQEIREERGLTYGVSSFLAPLEHASLILVSGSTVNARAAETLALIKAEWRRMALEGVTGAEVADAQRYLTGSFPLQFSSTGRTADLVLQMRRFDLGLDYLDRRRTLIESVTVDQVNAVARRILDVDALTVVVVGEPEGVEATMTVPRSDTRG